MRRLGPSWVLLLFLAHLPAARAQAEPDATLLARVGVLSGGADDRLRPLFLGEDGATTWLGALLVRHVRDAESQGRTDAVAELSAPLSRLGAARRVPAVRLAAAARLVERLSTQVPDDALGRAALLHAGLDAALRLRPPSQEGEWLPVGGEEVFQYVDEEGERVARHRAHVSVHRSWPLDQEPRVLPTAARFEAFRATHTAAGQWEAWHAASLPGAVIRDADLRAAQERENERLAPGAPAVAVTGQPELSLLEARDVRLRRAQERLRDGLDGLRYLLAARCADLQLDDFVSAGPEGELLRRSDIDELLLAREATLPIPPDLARRLGGEGSLRTARDGAVAVLDPLHERAMELAEVRARWGAHLASYPDDQVRARWGALASQHDLLTLSMEEHDALLLGAASIAAAQVRLGLALEATLARINGTPLAGACARGQPLVLRGAW